MQKCGICGDGTNKDCPENHVREFKPEQALTQAQPVDICVSNNAKNEIQTDLSLTDDTQKLDKLRSDYHELLGMCIEQGKTIMKYQESEPNE